VGAKKQFKTNHVVGMPPVPYRVGEIFSISASTRSSRRRSTGDVERNVLFLYNEGLLFC